MNPAPPNAFTKIKYDGKSVYLAWENANGDSADVYSFQCEEKPTPEFEEALTAMFADVIRVCDLPDDYANAMTVRGVTIGYGETTTCTITALKPVDTVDAPFTINTPNHPANMARLTPLLHQAQAYLMGERAQGTLNLEAK